MKKSFVVFIFLSLFSFSALADNQYRFVRNIYKEQCAAAGGTVNIFCMCTEKLDVINLVAEVADAAISTRKLSKNTLGLINPFAQSCSGQPLDADATYKRLNEMHKFSSLYMEDESILEEILLYEDLGLLEGQAFSEYLSNAKFKDKIKGKIAKLKQRHSMFTNDGVKTSLTNLGKANLKKEALAKISEITDIDIGQAKKIATAVKAVVQASAERAGGTSLKTSLIEIGKNGIQKTGKTVGKAMGKGFVVAVISAAAFEGISYAIGFDITKYDPFEMAFGISMAADATITGAALERISMVYTMGPELMDMNGFSSSQKGVFAEKLALTAMIAEARANGDHPVHFLDY